ncbi:hypothetical protein SAY87_013748 [Trapa incisa]|uniref:non-specific serine/threonine protein kinase n=1 Tax=Trapa incisa TaxID=236973 RepID=A0AAN7KBQ1_9MYRT|nr:hypothetical protein SAY87_013748 [Trapa incisa]
MSQPPPPHPVPQKQQPPAPLPPPPPPPPPFMSSSGGSGFNYSGPDGIYTPPSMGIALGFSKCTFTYDELAMATGGFTNANLLGQGGFGYVHKGVLPNGKEIAVKQLKAGSGQGEREFQAEVEIISRARPQLTRALEDGKFDSLIDPRLQHDYNNNEMTRMVACAAACVRYSARRRPRMSQIVRALEGDVSLSDLNEGMRPGHSGLFNSYGSSDYDTIQYKEDLKKFHKVALESTEQHGSSEYSEPTSEYGVYPSGSSSESQATREMEMEMENMKKSRQRLTKGSRV